MTNALHQSGGRLRWTAAIALTLVATLASSGCGVVSSATVSDGPGKSLEFVEDRLQPDVTLLIQDVSPRVGLAASYGLGDDELWTVVALCADSAVLDNATSVEVAVFLSGPSTSRSGT